MDVENNIVALFSVLYLNTKNFDYDNIPDPTVKILRELSKRGKNFELSSFLIAIFFSCLLCWFIYIAIQLVSIQLKPPEPKLHGDATQAGFFENENMQTAATWAMRSYLEHVFLVVVVSVVALVKRQEMLDDGSWLQNLEDSKHPSIGKYLAASVVPALIGSFILLLIWLAHNLYDQRNAGAEIITVLKISSGLREGYAYVVGSFFASLILVLILYLITDFHDMLSTKSTIVLGFFGALLISIIMFIAFELAHGFVQRLVITDTLKIGVFMSLYLSIYAFAVSFYEGN